MKTRALLHVLFLSCISVSIAEAQKGSSASALASWQSAHGPEWRVVADPETGLARMLYGGSATAASVPREDADFAGLARRALEDTRELFGIDVATLGQARVQFLPLGQIGSSDKYTVRLKQSVAGVPVVAGVVDVLFDASGRRLSVHSTALADLEGFSADPAVGAETADALARAQFQAEERLEPTSSSAAELVIEGARVGKRREARLAWQIDVRREEDATVPLGFVYWIDALDGQVLRRARSVHEFDVHGTVSSHASPGVLPDTSGNPESAQVLR